MTPAGTVEGDGRLRLFCALRLPDDAVSALAAWQAVHAGGRLVPAASMHLTLAFLGLRPAGELPAIAGELRAAAAAAERPVLTVERYRETRGVAMLVFADEGGRAAALAADVQERLERLGALRRERRPWLPHVTIARHRERPRLRPPLPELGRVVPSDAAVYLSRLRPAGAQYDVLETCALGG